MNLRSFSLLLLRRWWVIVLITAMAVAAAFGYSWRQQKIYAASATAQISAAPGLSSQQVLDILSLLSYGSIRNSVVSIAQSRSTLGQAADRLVGISSRQLAGYTAVATFLPQSDVLSLSVSGPDAKRVIDLTNSLSTTLADATSSLIPPIRVYTLDQALASSQIRPRTAHNLLYGGLAGLLVGLAVATASVYRPTRQAEPWRPVVEQPPPREPARLR